MENKKLSIVTTTYNCKDKLKASLDSVVCKSNLEQIEHVFIDSLSSDGTLDVIKSYCSRSKYDTKIISEKDKGIYDGLNKGTKESIGDFILVLHAGDLLTINIDQILKDIETRQGFDFITYSGTIKDDKSKSTKLSRHSYQLSIYNPAILHPCILIKRDVLIKYDGYDLSYKVSADYHLISKYFLDNNDNSKIAIIDNSLLEMEAFDFSASLSNFFIKKREHLKIIKPADFNLYKLNFYKRILKQILYKIVIK
jgi:glycosyltransferase